MSNPNHHESEGPKAPGGSNPQDCICRHVRMASRSLTQIYDRSLKGAGITSTQFGLLGSLMEGELRIGDMADIHAMDRTTLSRNLRLLEKSNFVVITPGADRRTRSVKLTTLGQKTFINSLPLWEAAQESVLQSLGLDRWDKAKSNLQDLSAALNAGF